MLKMVNSTYPLTRSKEVAEAFMKSSEKPLSYANRLGTWTGYGGEGVNVWSIYELEKGHEEEGSNELFKLLVNFYHIEGFKVNIQTVLKPEDAILLIQ